MFDRPFPDTYVEYHVIDGKVVPITQHTDWTRQKFGYPLDILRAYHGARAEMVKDLLDADESLRDLDRNYNRVTRNSELYGEC